MEACSRFKEVSYSTLNARQRELFNFQKIAATFADRGFNCIKLADDWQGADFLAYNVHDSITLKVQLKARLTIDQKYMGKDIWMAFPHRGSWYLIEHDLLVKKVGMHTKWLDSYSWKNKNGYSSISINADLLKSLAEDRLGPVYGTVLAV